MEDDIEGLEGEPDAQYNIIKGKAIIRGANLTLNVDTEGDILFDADDSSSDETPVNSKNDTVESSNADNTLQPQTSSGSLHPDIVQVAGNRSPVHTNNPELQDLIHGNTRRFWSDTDFKDIFDVFN